jgi:hypothetical protein
VITRILFLILISSNCLSQTIHLSRAEKVWAVSHPFAALKIRKIQKQITALYKPSELLTQLDSFSNGGKLDAFRHTFYMSAFAQKIKVKKIRKLGIAHEKSNYRNFLKSKTEDGELADSVACQMDLLNNELGFSIGKSNKKLSPDELKQLVIKEINNGKAVIVKRNKRGVYLSKDDETIDLKAFKGVWETPKWLVASDYVYKD